MKGSEKSCDKDTSFPSLTSIFQMYLKKKPFGHRREQFSETRFGHLSFGVSNKKTEEREASRYTSCCCLLMLRDPSHSAHTSTPQGMF